MSLLNMLVKKPEVELIVAHYNHGMRVEALADEEFVRNAATKLKLPFEVERGNIGEKASEETARQARYDFLNRVKVKHNALAIITAHHQDDMIETAFINLLRGTGRKGLVAISRNENILRPLLNRPKSEILAYADKHKLKWHEDESNTNTDYLRNHVRHNLVAKMDVKKRSNLIIDLDKVAEIDTAIEFLSNELSKTIIDDLNINRMKFAELPVAVADELLVQWLRQSGTSDFDRQTITRLNTLLRIAKPSTRHNVKRNLYLDVRKKTASFHTTP